MLVQHDSPTLGSTLSDPVQEFLEICRTQGICNTKFLDPFLEQILIRFGLTSISWLQKPREWSGEKGAGWTEGTKAMKGTKEMKSPCL